MVAVGQNDGTVQLWNAADPAAPATIGHPFIAPGAGNAYVSAVAFSPDGSVLATISGPFSGNSAFEQMGTVRMWNIADPKEPKLLRTTLISASTVVAFSPVGHTLITSAADDSMRLWNVTDASHPKEAGAPLYGHTGTVTGMAISPDGHTLATASVDNSVRLWNITDPAHATSMAIVGKEPTTDLFSSVAIGPKGLLAATAITNLNDSLPVRTWLWQTDPTRAAASVCGTASASITQAQWRQYFPDESYDPPCPGARPSPTTVWCTGDGYSDWQTVTQDLSQFGSDVGNDDISAVESDGGQLAKDAATADKNLPPATNVQKSDYGYVIATLAITGRKASQGDITGADSALQPIIATKFNAVANQVSEMFKIRH
jgi:WD40 repeat protein